MFSQGADFVVTSQSPRAEAVFKQLFPRNLRGLTRTTNLQKVPLKRVRLSQFYSQLELRDAGTLADPPQKPRASQSSTMRARGSPPERFQEDEACGSYPSARKRSRTCKKVKRAWQSRAARMGVFQKSVKEKQLSGLFPLCRPFEK